MRSACAQPWNIDVAYVPTLAQILTHDQYALNRVDVAVDPHRLHGQFPRWFRDLLYL
jgi:hypothetical protein